MNYFLSLPAYLQALVATIFTWLITALGASLVFMFKKMNKNILDATLGFAAGVMIAASFWSLLNPAIELANKLNMTTWLIVFLGFICGGLLLFIGDKIFNYITDNKKTKLKNKRIIMLIFSITLHNIPEGLAIGVAFGSAALINSSEAIIGALMLALGIGIQNFPEGSAISLPLLREGYTKKRAFFYGQLSAIVEPISAVLGAILVIQVQSILPFLLSFAAGAMIYVVVQELIPESQTNKRKEIMALFTMIGFSIMMILDVALG